MELKFKTKGIYARKVDFEKEFNYKPTKLGNIFRAAVGEKENAIYDIICFKEFYPLFSNDCKEPKINAHYAKNMSGEIFSLADWFENRCCNNIENVVFRGKAFVFEEKEMKFSGFLRDKDYFDDTICLYITNKETKESISRGEFRYIPWK